MIVVYSIPNCPYCKQLKDLLNDKKIEFIDEDVSLPKNVKTFAKIAEIANSSDVPMVRVDKQLFVPYVSFQSIEEAVALVEKFNV